MADPTVARRIRLRRQALRLSQQELADELGVHRTTVSAWERGTMAPDKHEGAIEAALGIDLSNPPAGEDPGEQQLRALDLPPRMLRILIDAYRSEAMRQSA